MPSLSQSIHRFLLLVVALSFALAGLCTMQACQSIGPLKQPQEAWVRADRETFELIAPRFARYVTDDPQLMPVEKKALLDVMIDWRVRLEQAEKAVTPVVLSAAAAPRPVHDPGVHGGAGPPGDGELVELAAIQAFVVDPTCMLVCR